MVPTARANAKAARASAKALVQHGRFPKGTRAQLEALPRDDETDGLHSLSILRARTTRNRSVLGLMNPMCLRTSRLRVVVRWCAQLILRAQGFNLLLLPCQERG